MAAFGERSRSDRVLPYPRSTGLHRGRLAVAVTILVLGACAHQPTPPTLTVSEYGLAVVDRLEVHSELVRSNPEKALVDLSRFIPTIRLDIRYATPNNFMQRALYPVAKAFLRCPAARALREVQVELVDRGLGLKVFDAYRPYRVTVEMWEPIRNPDYVADPAKGSRHNRGAAVDLTLVDLATGVELPMPTVYDDFTPRAAHAFMDLSEEEVFNRELLRDVMERHGFAALPSEWWHYDFRGWEQFEILDLPHRVLERGTRAACPVNVAP